MQLLNSAILLMITLGVSSTYAGTRIELEADKDAHFSGVQELLSHLDMEEHLEHLLGPEFAAHMGKRKVGIGINLEPDQKEKRGVYVLAVTPDGAAEQAGIKSGDIIIDVNGQSLKADDDSDPPKKLFHALEGIKVGDAVKVMYLRGDKTHSATLTAKALPHHMAFEFHHDGPGGHGEKRIVIKKHDGNIQVFSDGPLGDIEMVSLNPELGEYFGTQTGLLVVAVPDDSELELKPGDVILKLGQRSPKDPSQAWRILNSYDSGEVVKVTLMRKNKQRKIDLKIP